MWKSVSLALMLAAAPALAAPVGVGAPALPEEIAAWDRDVRPDGVGLPDGSGSVFDGEEVFTDNCAACHGDFGEGVGRFPPLAGGQDALTDERPIKSVGSYWPHLSTVFDYIRRAQPFGAPGTLTDDEIYAVTAYILYLNDLVEDEDFVLDADSFRDIRLPNEAGFIDDNRPDTPIAAEGFCMSDCRAAPAITARASDLALEDDGGE